MAQTFLGTDPKSGQAANQLPVIEQVLSLTEAMRHAAQLSDWREVEVLSNARHPILMSIVANQPPAALALIRRIQTMSDEIARDAEAARNELTAEYHAALKKTSSAQAYLQGARL